MNHMNLVLSAEHRILREMKRYRQSTSSPLPKPDRIRIGEYVDDSGVATIVFCLTGVHLPSDGQFALYSEVAEILLDSQPAGKSQPVFGLLMHDGTRHILHVFGDGKFHDAYQMYRFFRYLCANTLRRSFLEVERQRGAEVSGDLRSAELECATQN